MNKSKISVAKKNVIKTVAVVGLLNSVMILGVSAHSVDASNHEKQVATSEVGTQELGVVTRGSMNVSGTGASGLHLQGNNTVTTGTLDFDYEGKSIVSIGLNESTDYVMSVPAELVPLFNNSAFTNYITGNFQFNNGSKYAYNKNDIRVEDGGKTLRIKNPTQSWFAYADFKVHLSLDLGQMVTDTGIRVADAENNSSYIFTGGLVKNGSSVDWDVVGSYNASYTLPTHRLDPGWTLLQEVPTVEAIYDTDTTVTGRGVPGAKIQIKVGDKVIGTGIVDENGIYVVTIPKQYAGVTVKANQNTGVGWSKDREVIVKHKDATIAKPQVNTVTENSKAVTGKGETAGNIIIIADADGNEIGRGVVQANRAFNIPIPGQDAYTLLYVTETNGTETSLPTIVPVHAVLR